jgi:hypothetical protein
MFYPQKSGENLRHLEPVGRRRSLIAPYLLAADSRCGARAAQARIGVDESNLELDIDAYAGQARELAQTVAMRRSSTDASPYPIRARARA